MTKIKHQHFLKFKLLLYAVACYTDTSKVTPSQKIHIEVRKNKKIGQVGVNNVRTTGNMEAKSEFPFQALHEI